MRYRRDHRRAVVTITVALVLDVLAGISFSIVDNIPIFKGLYWAIATATTVGYGDLIPHTTLAHILAVLVMTTVVPLFAATFSLLTSAVTSEHVHKEGEQAKRRLDHIVFHHPNIPELPSYQKED